MCRILSGFAGSVYGRPTLEPETSVYGCPEDTSVTLTCHDHEVQAMAWKADPYIPDHNPIILCVGSINSNRLTPSSS